MQNDAKLGLLAGVVGVIIAATISGKSPSASGTTTNPQSGTSPQSTPVTNYQAKSNDVAATAVVPGDSGSTPVARTKKNIDATTISRTTQDEE